jgi:hypothetical protein
MKKIFITVKQQVFALAMLCGVFAPLHAQLVPDETGTATITISAIDELKAAIDATDDKSAIDTLRIGSSIAVPLSSNDAAGIQLLTSLKTLDMRGITANNYTLPEKLLYRNQTVKTFYFPPNAYRVANWGFVLTAIEGEVNVPAVWNGPTYLRPGFWANNPGMTAVNIPAACTTLASVDGVVFTKDMTQIVYYPAGRPDEVYQLPSTVTGINTAAPTAFNYSKYLKKLIFPAGFQPPFPSNSSVYTGTTITTHGSIEAFEVDPENPYIGAVNGMLYQKGRNILFYAPPGLKGEVRIGEPIQRIQGGGSQNSAFGGNATTSADYFLDGVAVSDNKMLNFTLIDLPATIDTIYNGAFVNGRNVSIFICRAITPPRIGQTTLDWTNTGKLYVPAASLDDYLSSTWVANSAGIDCDGNSKTGFKGFNTASMVGFYAITVAAGTATSPLATDIAASGQTVAITADPAPEGKIFDRWTASGDNLVFENATSPTTSFVMPAADVALAASYRDDPATALNALHGDDAAPVVTLYPNPAGDHIRLSGIANRTPYTIYNALGQVVAQGIANNDEPISVAHLSTGIYSYTILKPIKLNLFIKK